MSRFVDARLVPVVVALDDRTGVTIWAPPWVGREGYEKQGFAGDGRQVVVCATVEELAAYLAHNPAAALSDHPAWPALLRKEPAELRAEPGNFVDFDDLFVLLAGEPTIESREAVSKAIQLATAIAEFCGDLELRHVLDREPYRRAAGGNSEPAGRVGANSWPELAGEVTLSWEWVLEHVAQHIRWIGDAGQVDLEAIQLSADAVNPWRRADPLRTEQVAAPDPSAFPAPMAPPYGQAPNAPAGFGPAPYAPAPYGQASYAPAPYGPPLPGPPPNYGAGFGSRGAASSPAKSPGFGVVGLAWVAVGFLVVGVALLATRWLSLDIEGANGLKFSDLHDAATSGDQSGASRLALAYFSWLAWVLLGVTVIVSLLALYPATSTTNVRILSAIIGVGAAALTFFSIKLDSSGGSYGEYLKHSGPGFWMAIVGFLLIGAGGSIGLQRSVG